MKACDPSQRGAASSLPEDLFVELFGQVFGLEKTQLLAPQYPVLDIYGTARFIDFALRTADHRIAFEVDGPSHYQPPDFDLAKFEDDLRRQNSLVHAGWRVFRWSDRELAQQSDQVKEQLALFLEQIPGLLELSDFLPKQAGAALDWRAHQREALDWLAGLRQAGMTIALLEHATGVGKTYTAISDARRVGTPVLYVAHRKNLVEQTARGFRRHWPEARLSLLVGGRPTSKGEPEPDLVCATIQTLVNRLKDFKPDAFQYLIIDEAHHAAADSYRTVLGHFTPHRYPQLSPSAVRWASNASTKSAAR